ncbi:MAG TPA: recombinase A [Candidatus Binatia bacterium]|nr:recombinase A [Candidatus Binatia bacterium]
MELLAPDLASSHQASSSSIDGWDRPIPWDLPELAGRLTQITRSGAGAALTFCADLLWKAQHRGEPCAWISAQASSFFPPDLHASGIDLAALPFIRTPDAAAAARAADKLLRSGAFGLVLLDLGLRPSVPSPLLSRLLALARKHNAAVILLTEHGAEESLAPIVSLRATTLRHRAAPDRFVCSIRADKDKNRGPGWAHEETFRGPPGLR